MNRPLCPRLPSFAFSERDGRHLRTDLKKPAEAGWGLLDLDCSRSKLSAHGREGLSKLPQALRIAGAVFEAQEFHN